MKFKLISILLIASLIASTLPVGTYAVAAPSTGEDIVLELDTKLDVEGFIENMNKEIEDIYGIDSSSIKFEVSTKFGTAKIYQVYLIKGNAEEFLGYTFAYGNPFGDKKTIETKRGKKTVYRYLGKALKSTSDPNDGFTNIEFPYDAYSGWTFPDLLPGSGYHSTFIEYPWLGSEDKVGKRLDSSINFAFYSNKTATGKLKQQIVTGLVLVHPEMVSKNLGPDGRVPAEDIKKLEQIPWEKHVHIYQPPTYSAWGMGVIWHKSKRDGKIWYKTIPIAPYQLVESKYGIITLGFLDDGKVGTIDILESVDSKNQERLLKTISEDVVVQLSSFWEQFYRYTISNYGKDPYNVSDEEFDNAFDEFYNSYSEKEALATAYSDVYWYQSTPSNRPKERE